MSNQLHTPVMLKEVTKYLNPKPGKKYLDATLGYGGHTLSLLEQGATVVGIDQDADMLELAYTRITESGFTNNFTPMHSSFASALSGDRFADHSFDGILFDLGASSYQFDTPQRGFSFRFDAPLDMRMNKDLAVTARDLVNGLGKNELVNLFKTLGEEHAATKIATAICERRKIKSIETTLKLAKLIERTIPKYGKIHPATKVFQSLRMAVNSEREELKAALPSALSKLTRGGVLAAISFHSLEEQIILEFFQNHLLAITLLTPSPLTPSSQEIISNARSRSAKLRVGEKI